MEFIPDDQLPTTDPLELSRQFNELRAKQIAANEGEGEGLTAAESRYAIQLTRILRRTNTGPKKARAAGKPKKEKITKEQLDHLFDDL